MTAFQEKVYPVRKTKRNHNEKRKSKFSNGVFQVVKKIPRGGVLSYKEVAKLAGEPRAWRAVGNILNKNRDPKIPCHRIIKSNGEIGGYKSGTKKKKFLLKREKVIIK